jgi:hypothetical protein
MQKTLVIILIVVIVALSGVIIWQNLGSKSPAVNNQPPISDETADWKTYTNEQYGFEMKYPSDWSPIEITDSLQRQHLYHFQTPDGEIVFNVGQESYTASLEEYINSTKNTLLNAEGGNYIVSEKKEITVDGRKAIEIPNRGNNYEEVLIFVKNDNSIYEIVFTTKSNRDDVLILAEVLNQMLSTFKFIK